jgi:hypothetical protein
MLQPVSVIAELEEAVRSGSSAKRISTLRQVTDLFLRDADSLGEDQVKVHVTAPPDSESGTNRPHRARSELGGKPKTSTCDECFAL